jgi:hypothetical protein
MIGAALIQYFKSSAKEQDPIFVADIHINIQQLLFKLNFEHLTSAILHLEIGG